MMQQFQILYELPIEPGYAVLHTQCVRELKRIGYEAWKKKYEYGMRWASEGFFSAVKRIFGEDVRATSREGMIQEVRMKFLFYNMIVHSV